MMCIQKTIKHAYKYLIGALALFLVMNFLGSHHYGFFFFSLEPYISPITPNHMKSGIVKHSSRELDDEIEVVVMASGLKTVFLTFSQIDTGEYVLKSLQLYSFAFEESGRGYQLPLTSVSYNPVLQYERFLDAVNIPIDYSVKFTSLIENDFLIYGDDKGRVVSVSHLVERPDRTSWIPQIHKLIEFKHDTMEYQLYPGVGDNKPLLKISR